MEMKVKGESKSKTQKSEDEMGVRKGSSIVEEDTILVNYILWNSVACCAGLKRIGKGCRLRWLNYFRPDGPHGNITLQEQILILDLHSRWGNRWSKIAQHLPGRTYNEIKIYWRTRVMRQAMQLKCDVNSKQFRDTMRSVWMPRLLDRIRAAASEYNPTSQPTPFNPIPTSATRLNPNLDHAYSSALLPHHASNSSQNGSGFGHGL